MLLKGKGYLYITILLKRISSYNYCITLIVKLYIFFFIPFTICPALEDQGVTLKHPLIK